MMFHLFFRGKKYKGFEPWWWPPPRLQASLGRGHDLASGCRGLASLRRGRGRSLGQGTSKEAGPSDVVE